MGLAFTRDDLRRRLFVTATDPVTLAETMALQAQQTQDGTWRYAILYDARARKEPFRGSEVHQLEEQTESLSRSYGLPGPVAILAGNDVTFGVGRMYEILSDRVRPVAVFREFAHAEHWLDIQQATETPSLR